MADAAAARPPAASDAAAAEAASTSGRPGGDIAVSYQAVLTGRIEAGRLPANCSVEQARDAAAAALGFPPDRTSLIHNGRKLAGGPLKLQAGDTLLVILRPPRPSEGAAISAGSRPSGGLAWGGRGGPGPGADAGDDDSDSDEALAKSWRFRLPANAPPYRRKLAHFLRVRCRLPGWLCVILFSITARAWVLAAAWAAGLLLAARYEVGPIFLLATGFALIFFNLGTRRPGEASAYNVFNECFRELPGTLNANHLDDQIRRGQM